MLRLDGIIMLVPATWDIPGAAPIPTAPNKDFAEGRLEPFPADVRDLVTAGTKLPGTLFEAAGANWAAGSIGVMAGVYDTGSNDPISLVRKTVAEVTPGASVDPTTVSSEEGVRTLRRVDDASEGGSVICDYWSILRHSPTSVFLLRLWRTGPAHPDEEELFDDVAGSVLFSDPLSWAGPAGKLMAWKYGPPKDEVVEPGRLRYAGWRLGTVFHSRMISAREAEFATELSGKSKDALLLVVVFFAWLAATLTLVGVGPVLLLGGMMTAGTMPQLRSRGSKAVVMLALALSVLLAFGVATS